MRLIHFWPRVLVMKRSSAQSDVPVKHESRLTSASMCDFMVGCSLRQQTGHFQRNQYEIMASSEAEGSA